MAGEGHMLRVAREEKKWSYLDAEEITKISVRYIKALEEEKYEILPGTTYAKGYLRTYAKHLGLNSDEIIDLFKASATPEPDPIYDLSETTGKTRPSWFRPLLIGSMAVLTVVLIIVIASLNRSANRPVNPADLPGLPSAPQTDLAPQQASPSEPVVVDNDREPPVDNSADNPAETPGETAAETPPDGLSSEEIPGNSDGDAQNNAAVAEGLTALLAFTQDCWMLIRIDDESEFQEVFSAGATRELKALNKIEFVSIGNANGLAVTLNGKALPSFADEGRIINNVVLTQDTLNN